MPGRFGPVLSQRRTWLLLGEVVTAPMLATAMATQRARS